ncbi:hypothetical protein [Pleurocapsa sp. FMAR1]|nr:hypothetical protein [Pleurocapsa sp. FMAR1]
MPLDFTEGQVAAPPNSSLDATQRREIIKAAYQFRDRLIKAQNKLGIT